MLNGDRSHSTKMSLKYRSLKFELNLPQMRVSFEKRHSQLGGRVKTHRTTGLIRRQEPDGETGWATTMWFLIKGSFWFGLVLVLLSVFSTESSDKLANGPQLQLSDAFTAASGAYDYLTGMCSEKPEVCAKGSETLTALGYRAREGARVAYELLDSQFKDEALKRPQGLANRRCRWRSTCLPSPRLPSRKRCARQRLRSTSRCLTVRRSKMMPQPRRW